MAASTSEPSSLAATGCQQMNTNRPPGRNEARMLAKAAVKSSKNITPKRDTATAK
jgi:hypothetical protein